MSSSFRRFLPLLFALLIALLFPSCTGKQGAPHIDTDTVLGVKTYFNASSATNAKAIVSAGSGFPATLVTITNSVVTASTNLDPSAVQFSSDGKIVTLVGQPGIFEYSPVTVATIVSGSTPAPTPKIDTYCINVQAAGFDQLSIQAIDGVLTFVGVSSGVSSIVGGPGTIYKTNLAQGVEFKKDGFGTLSINENFPLSTDFTFFKATLALTVASPWQSVNNMYCHLNNVTVPTNPPASLSVQTLFTMSTLQNGNLGGLAGADALCAARAQAGSATSALAGKWRAILSSSTVDAKDRIPLIPGVNIKNTNGEVLVAVAANLWAGALSAHPGYSESAGGPYASTIYSGTNANGTRTSSSANALCNDWTDGSTDPGSSGGKPSNWSTGVPAGWIQTGFIDGCNYTYPIYCINSNN